MSLCATRRVASGSKGQDARRKRRRVRSTPSWNPQNVPDPEVMPTVAMGASQAVSAQLQALQQVDEPRPDHGIQVMYVFANDGGGMERSRYFGYSKDIYHFDHFLGGFRNAFPELLNLQDFQVLGEVDAEPGRVTVNVSIVDRKGIDVGQYAFFMGKRTYGTLKDCWLTDRIQKE